MALAAAPETVPAEAVTRASHAHTAAAGRNRLWLRRLHAIVGLISSLNLFLLLASGFLLQHRETFRLEERTLSRRWLAASYRPQDGPEGVRADIVVADLHSGRMFGRTGALILDGLTVGWLALLVSGLFLYAVNHWRKENGGRNGNGKG